VLCTGTMHATTHSLREWQANLVQNWVAKSTPTHRLCVIHAAAEEELVQEMEDTEDWLESLSDPDSSSSSSLSSSSWEERASLFADDLDDWGSAAPPYSAGRHPTSVSRSPVKPVALAVVDTHPLSAACEESTFPDQGPVVPESVSSATDVERDAPPRYNRTSALPPVEDIELDYLLSNQPPQMPVTVVYTYTPPARYVANSSQWRITCLEAVMIRNRKIVAPLRPRAGQWKSGEELRARRSRSGSMLKQQITVN
jgi:hypothetical protein